MFEDIHGDTHVITENKRSFRRIGPGGGGGQLRPQISPHDPDTLFITCDMTGWFQTRDAGRSWRNINLKGVVRSAAFDPTDPAVIYAGNSGLYRSTDTGRTWRLIWPDPAKVTAEVECRDHADHRYESTDNWPGGLVLGIAVDPADGRPVFVGAHERQRIRRLLARIRMRPLVRCHLLGRMRCVPQHVVFAVRLARENGLDLAVNGEHRVTEAG